MTIKTRLAGAIVTFNRMRVQVGGTLRPVLSVKMLDAGTFRTIALLSTTPGGGGGGAIAATVEPSEAYASKGTVKPTILTTDVVTVSPTGGTLPYHYAWARISAIAGVTATRPTFATTAFTGLVSNISRYATFRCTVTDANGATVFCDVSVQLDAQE
jgi:hypothetical protein